MSDIDLIRKLLVVSNLPGRLDREIVSLIAEAERLRAYVEADCHCPCCDTDRHCMGGCTFQSDAPDAWERMVAARKAMWGDNKPDTLSSAGGGMTCTPADCSLLTKGR